MNEKEIKEAMKLLEKAGYNVKISKPTIKKTFEIAEDLLEQFENIRQAHKLKSKEAIHQAISEWVSKMRKNA